jgi:transcriptional regulator with XRE-family HTH domain
MVKPIKHDCPACAGTGKIPRGAYLRQLRTERQLTLQWMADRLGFSRAYLSDVELDKRRATPKVRRAYGEL